MRHLVKIDSLSIAQRFAKAGESYHQHAVVQKQIAFNLVQLMQQNLPQPISGHYLEIGCGSGHLSHLLLSATQQFQIDKYYCNDLYEEVQQHFTVDPRIKWLIGDIEQLVLPQALQLLISSSALQWMQDIDALFSKIHTALAPQAFFCFSSFSQDNLKQIKALTGQGLDYLSLSQWQAKLEQHGFEVMVLQEQIEHIYFPHPLEILKHLKATGVTATSQHYRWTKQSLQQFYLNYEDFAVANVQGQLQYPLTYHPFYCIARRTT
ncbi:malonyl-ACP O-methyltransferase BioC [Acinetobacter rudis]|uniref:Malonyl-[acyl-carrier protein] O-methyltransferase n=1 Tax=Acinetobacter rudis TaxID=632955 RepID=A0AAW8J6U8_9GAMM|nr:malonyl-ACP O-methyltransferase BioC [Acinetobacter rudis]MDQ8935449.1 malonyl-ACP O-methyltransferase BioC [Acinetobacter rudis]MDQ9017784.1 malonyl-ACP O-methyltransferase BioC [Acinetobacter rudis]